MPYETEPLLAHRPSSINSADDDNRLAQEDALLTGQSPPNRLSFWRRKSFTEWLIFVWAFAATVVVIVLAVVYQNQKTTHFHPSPSPPHANTKRNLIFMVSDGMGPTSLSVTRSFRQFTQGLPFSDTLVLDDHLIGQSRTRSSSSLVTDSAAGATAFSCGKKSYNGAISVLPDHNPCGTVLEAAKREGYMTGLVVTTRITDATPACFASHVKMREEEDSIAEQLVGEGVLGRTVDLLLGGGRCHFLPIDTDGGCRNDTKDIVASAKDKGYKYISTKAEFDDRTGSDASLPLPFLGLFAHTDIPYEIDRRYQDETYPSLSDMAAAALKSLSTATRDSDKGFFLLIEGSRIDHAGHGNDPAAQVHEVLAYDSAFSTVLDFIETEKQNVGKGGVESLLVATSDHETGGLAAARQLHSSYPEYLWYPEVLANASHSAHWVAVEWLSYLRSLRRSASARDDSISRLDITAHLKYLLSEHLGIDDPEPVELSSLLPPFSDHTQPFSYQLAEMISKRAQLGWSSHGHTAADVNIYASNAEAANALRGNRENIEVGQFLREWLGVDVKTITKELKDKIGKIETEEGEELSSSRMIEYEQALREEEKLMDDYIPRRFAKRYELLKINGLPKIDESPPPGAQIVEEEVKHLGHVLWDVV
ncbi:MAG: hypothetical protein M1820_005243 [Bogoriella megaspora]|nr:MAG: hypothetical protein M1820_005243 [Bogoriella megaspora]